MIVFSRDSMATVAKLWGEMSVWVIVRPFVQIDEIGRVGYTVVIGLHRPTMTRISVTR